MAEIDTSIYKNTPKTPFSDIGDIQRVIGAAQGLTNLGKSQNEAVEGFLGALADSGLGKSQLMEHALAHSRSTNVPWSIYKQYLNGLSDSAQERKKQLTDFRLRAMGPAAAGSIVPGPQTPTGEATRQPYGGAAQEMAGGTPGAQPATPERKPPQAPSAAAPRMSGGAQIMTPPAGFGTAAESNVQAAQTLHSAADTIPTQRGMLDNLRDLSAEAATGPTAEVERKINALWQRFFPGSGLTLTAKQLSSTEEFAKIAEQIAGAQAQGAHATDAYLRNAYGANPNLQLSKLGRDGIINMLHGNFDAIEATRTAWMDYKNGLVDGRQHADNEYRDWIHRFNRGVDFKTGKLDPAARFDPRVFQFARMTPTQRKEFLSIMKEKPGGEFERRLARAVENGWINP